MLKSEVGTCTTNSTEKIVQIVLLVSGYPDEFWVSRCIDSFCAGWPKAEDSDLLSINRQWVRNILDCLANTFEFQFRLSGYALLVIRNMPNERTIQPLPDVFCNAKREEYVWCISLRKSPIDSNSQPLWPIPTESSEKSWIEATQALLYRSKSRSLYCFSTVSTLFAQLIDWRNQYSVVTIESTFDWNNEYKKQISTTLTGDALAECWNCLTNNFIIRANVMKYSVSWESNNDFRL